MHMQDSASLPEAFDGIHPIFFHRSIVNVRIHTSDKGKNFLKFNNATCFSLLDHLQAWIYIIKKACEMH